MANKEYIERGALIDKLKELKEEWGFTFTADGVEEAIFAVEEEPAADMVEVRHGEWTLIGYGNGRPLRWKCSACGYETLDAVNGDTNFCPNCGAKMDGERDDKP